MSGYLGDNVTLLSEADPTWILSTIEWSVFSNNTWIATYRNRKENVDRLDQYKGRLRLNTSSGKRQIYHLSVKRNHYFISVMTLSLQCFSFHSLGDLMIYNLTTKDAMEYTLDLINTEGQDSVNKVKLIVRRKCH